MVKEASDLGPDLSLGPSRFILSLGPCGGKLGVKGPEWWWVGSMLGSGPWLVGSVSGLEPWGGLQPSPHSRPCRMILSVLTGLLFGSDGYYVALAWTSSALMYFIVSLGCLCPSSPGQSWG